MKKSNIIPAIPSSSKSGRREDNNNENPKNPEMSDAEQIKALMKEARELQTCIQIEMNKKEKLLEQCEKNRSKIVSDAKIEKMEAERRKDQRIRRTRQKLTKFHTSNEIRAKRNARKEIREELTEFFENFLNFVRDHPEYIKSSPC